MVAPERFGTLSYVGVDGPIVRGKEGVSWWGRIELDDLTAHATRGLLVSA